MNFGIQNFTGTFDNGDKYIVEIEETNGDGRTTIEAKISRYDMDQSQYKYFDHETVTGDLWRDVLYEALLRLELKHQINLIKLKLEE